MKYNVGDRVKIKSLDWYNENRSKSHGTVACGGKYFDYDMREWCGKTLTIQSIGLDFYIMEEDNLGYEFTDEMIEGLVEEETKPKFKVGDRVIARGASGIWEITNVEDDILYTIKRENHTFTMTTYGGFLTLYEGISDKMVECKVEEENKPKFKVGDTVKWYNHTCNITSIDTNENTYTYLIKHNDYREDKTFAKWVPESELTVEDDEETKSIDFTIKATDTKGKVEVVIPEGYGYVVENDKLYFITKKKNYPKTYEECAKIMNCPIDGPSGWLFNFDANIKDPYYRKIDILMGKFTRLLICRDAYWKIAGEEMGLGKPWNPDWDDDEWPDMYYISFDGKRLEKEKGYPCCNMILIFPTEEMRDAFYENFKVLIEQCKELL